MAPLLGASLWPTLLAGLLYLASVKLPRTLAVLSLLVAPILWSLGGELTTVAQTEAVVWAALALLAGAPVMLRLGEAVPWRGAAVVLLGAPVLLFPLVVVRWGPSVFASDVAARAQVALLAMATLILLSLLELWTKKRSANG